MIHCTATRDDATVEAIQGYWRAVIGWRNPGYHFLIDKTGTVHRLAPLEKVTNGVRGYNHSSIHISYIGGAGGEDTRTTAQKSSILNCIREVIQTLGYQPVIQGHRDFPGVKKSCPNYDAVSEYSWITV